MCGILANPGLIEQKRGRLNLTQAGQLRLQCGGDLLLGSIAVLSLNPLRANPC